MWKVVLVIDGKKGENTFETRSDAIDTVTKLQKMFIEQNFKFVAYHRLTGFLLYLREEDDVRGRIGTFLVPQAKKEGEPFLRTRKNRSNDS
jgi:hypothetical protein